jgi:hypothetical protein
MLELLQVSERIPDAPKSVNTLEDEFVLKVVLPEAIDNRCQAAIGVTCEGAML